MKNNILFIIIIFVILTISGCISSDIYGKYVSELDSRNYIELFEDGTFITTFYDSGSRSLSGIYSIDSNNNLTLTYAMYGEVKKAKLVNNSIIDNSGTKWILTKE